MIAELKIGAGTDEGVEMGPLVTREHLERVRSYIDLGVKEGATLVVDGRKHSVPGHEHGFYLGATLFDDVQPQMRIYREEIFGPVLAIVGVTSYDDAIAKANDTEYGLSAAIATSNPRYMHRFADDIEAGTVKINRTTTGNVINAPFGGLKRSSTSTFRESGRAGLEFYTQIKTVYRGL
jgi:aldehyde dehydrogenase (NAD+)